MKYKYYKDKDFDKDFNNDDFYPAANIFVKVDDIPANPGNVVVYSPIGQHSEADINYIKNDCIEISKKEYLKISKGIYTPEEYIEKR